MVKHVVLMKLKEWVNGEQVEMIFHSVAELKEKVAGITEFAWGPYSSPEALNQGYTHAFIMTFESPEARDAYLPHPEHQKVKELILSQTDGVLAFDFAV